VPALTAARARSARLASLLLADHSLHSPAEIVTWFGAMQAQDAASVVWSLGLRLPGATEAAVLAALANHEILRTWPMRGTIHLVPSRDAAWMLDLTGSKALAAAARRREQLGLTLADAETATAALADALAGARLLTRAEALAVVNDAGIATDGQRGYHLLLFAAQTGVICIGPQVDGGQTFVLLDEWAPHQRRLDAREGAAELAFRYFRSHGPTTVADFAGWTGLGLGVSRQAVADNDGRLVPAVSAGETVWFAPEALEESRSIFATHVLPGFDEFMLGYKDRSLHVPEGRFESVVPGGNGVFRSTVVTRGIVEGTWTRTLTATTVKVTVEPFAAPSAARRTAMEHAFETYAAFLGRRLTLTVREPAA
jgi:hypothetical protein